MASSEPTANNFCPLPFTGLFYQNNSASPCCAMKTDPASPYEYLASKETNKLREDFANGLKPERCNNCWIKERNGHASIRKHYSKQERDLTRITHLELRESNLCNFSCRMCNADDSVVIDRETKSNPEIQHFFRPNNDISTTDDNWNQILEIVKGVESINLTGGEPMLMKRYYDLFDYMISIGKNEDVFLNIFTNGSVYNPLFVEKILKFKNVRLTVSIDAVEKIAEYQRKGTNWSTVSSNISKYMQLPIDIGFHSTITAYSILGLSSLADFFVDLYNSKRATKSIIFNVHTM
jgi:sulfatase maturation enzyme AslB (radical SAM superfamily)